MKNSKPLWRALLFLMLIATLCGSFAFPVVNGAVQAAPKMAGLSNLIISEVRFRGSGGTNDEFIEIFNPTGAAVNLKGWKINANSGNRYTFPTDFNLQPGQHYLITHTGFDDPIEPDAIYLASIADDGGVSLIDPNDFVVDQVGLSNSGYFEGTPLPPLTDNVDQSYDRSSDSSGICIDTDNNSTDYFLRNPSDPQNSKSQITPATCSNPTPTTTSTPTTTATPTQTIAPTRTSTPGVCGVSVAPTSVIINEVAWAGTAAATSDQWIELYNPTAISVNMTGWVLKGADGTPNISLNPITLLPNQYYLLERDDDNTVSDVTADQFFNVAIGASGEILQLYNSSGQCVDTANSNGGAWPAGNSYKTMERRGVVTDSDTAWITNVQSSTWKKHDARGTTSTNYLIQGTPGYANWAVSVTPTPAPVRTATHKPTPTRTLTPPPPPPLVAINEFVPRPGHDWNNDGVVNVGDEYIELLNHGVINVNLSGYSLDDEVNVGSAPYRLPAVTIRPGERIVFYGSETDILLGDGGDGVRLLKPNGQLGDAYNYSVVERPDQSYCRLPDNGGADDWNQNCYPTPGLQNSLNEGTGGSSSNSSAELYCPIADTLPDDFVQAECEPFGNNIWRSEFWDKTGWYGEQALPGIDSKWPVFAN